MKVLVFGHKGWIGSQLVELIKNKHDIMLASCRADDIRGVTTLLQEHKPTHVVSLIGRTHGPGFSTIDYLQQPDTLKENVRDNLFAPVSLALLCKAHGAHFTYLGTGCIFNSENKETMYDEDDRPDFFGSNYSIVKGMTDELMHLLKDCTLNIRIRMPITSENHPRNFITKILNYEKVCSIPNSMTVLPILLPYVIKLMEMCYTGTINMTNPGVISHNEILQMYKDIVDPSISWQNFSLEDQNAILMSKRSNNHLSTRLLESIFPEVPDIHTAMRTCLLNWKQAPTKSRLDDHDCVLITGGCGAIGSEVINYLKRKYADTMFVNLDMLTYAGNESNIEPPYDNYTFVLGNICDMQIVNHVLQKYKPTMIIHFAAESHVDTSFGNSFKFTETNVMGTHVLLECARKHPGIRKFVHMSTDEVYGSVDDESVCSETSMFKPSNPYSASKAAAEMLCHAYIMSFKLPLIILRCNNAISKYQHPEKLIPKAIQCIMTGKRIPIHGNGQSKRTFIHTDDIASAIDVICTKGSIFEIYNIGTTLEYTVLDVVTRILKIMLPKANMNDWIEYVADRNFQDYRYSIDISKLTSLGWTSRVTFDESLERLVRHITTKTCDHREY